MKVIKKAINKSKKSLREKMIERRAEMARRAAGGSDNLIYIKEGTLRVRPLYVGPEKEFILPVTQFYLGPKIKGVLSPSSIGKPCALEDEYNRLKDSSKDEDKALAKKMSRRARYVMAVAVYKDLKGQEIDEERSGKFVLLTNSTAQDVTDKWLDDDEWGDMTDPNEGYDLKIGRTGKGKLDTEYSVTPCKNTPAPKSWRKLFPLDEEFNKIFPSFEDTEAKLEDFLSGAPEEEEATSNKATGKKVIRKKRDL